MTATVRVLMVVDAAPPQYGGAGQQALLIADRVSAEGKVTVQIVARRKQDLDPAHPRVRFLGKYRTNERLSNLIFAGRVAVFVLRSRPQIVHIHGAYYYGLAAALAARLVRARSILKMTLLGGDDPDSLREIRQLGLPVGRLLARQYRLVDEVIVLNEEGLAAVAPMRPSATLMPNGIDLSMIPSRQRGGEVSLRAIFTGNVGTRKGADTLLRAWKTVLETEPSAKLVLAGPITDPETIEALVSDLPAAAVELTGPLTHEQVMAELDAASVFILPSHAEGLPNSLLEALGAGLACVVSDIPVMRSTVADAASYCNPDSASEVASAIMHAWTERADLSARSLRRREHFRIERVVSFYSRLYTSLVQSAAKPGADRSASG